MTILLQLIDYIFLIYTQSSNPGDITRDFAFILIYTLCPNEHIEKIVCKALKRFESDIAPRK